MWGGVWRGCVCVGGWVGELCVGELWVGELWVGECVLWEAMSVHAYTVHYIMYVHTYVKCLAPVGTK